MKRRAKKDAPFDLPANMRVSYRGQAELTSNVVWVVQWLKKSRSRSVAGKVVWTWDWATAHKGPSEGAALSIYRKLVSGLRAGVRPHARMGVGYADGIGTYVWVSTAKVREKTKGK